MNNAVGYIRVSTPRQVRTGNSLKNQRKMIEKYAFEHNLDVEIYSDNGISGYKIRQRDNLKLLLNRIEWDKQVKYLIVSKLDRISRNAKDLINILELCKKKNIKLISVMENLSSNNSIMQMQVSLIGAVAEFQRSIIRENVISSIQYKYDNGIVFSGMNVPLGYQIVDNEIKINHKNSKVVKSIFDLYVFKRFGYRKIANFIGEKYNLNISTLGVKKILNNQVYIGKSPNLIHPQYVVFKPIVDKDIFSKVQIIMNSKHKATKKRYDVLRGLLYCPVCNHRLSVNYVSKYEYYYCWYGINRSKQSVNYHTFRVNALKVKQSFLGYLNSIFQKSKNMNEILNQLFKTFNHTQVSNKLLYEQFENNVITMEDLKKALCSNRQSKQSYDLANIKKNAYLILNMSLNEIISMIVRKITVNLDKQGLFIIIGNKTINLVF